MNRLYPAINLLRAFVATARHASVSRAADELHLTQSPVSKRILELEQQLGTALFVRQRQRLSLAPSGQRYLARVKPLLAQLETATLELIAHGVRGGGLHLLTLPTFGAKWLIPKLPQFTGLHPEVTLQFVPFAQGYDFSLPELDCAIRYGNGHWDHAESDYLTGQHITLNAPSALKAKETIRRAADVTKHTLLQHVSVPGEWANWCAAYGVKHPAANSGATLDQYTSLIRAVMSGMGIALVPSCLVQENIDAGLVAAPLRNGADSAKSAEPYQSSFGYYRCYPPERAQVPALAVFRDWILKACADESHT